ncbi:MAG: thiol reductase thioredoxin [Arcobacter sp.]|nr:MAG: thiol reductase thioredoxin [Arcobacter sp.]
MMTIEKIEQEIKTNGAVLLYFSGENCGVCKALRPKIESAFTVNFPKIKQIFINANEYPKIAAHFSIFTVPSILIYFDTKEIKRESRHISVSQLVQSIKRPYELFFH